MLQTREIAAARIQNWFRKHPSVAETDKNIAILMKYIRDYFSVSGETVIDEAYLDLAYRNIGSTLQHIVGPEIQQQIAQINQQAAELLAEKQRLEAEKNRKAEEQRKQIEKQARQDANQPGVASAYGDREEITREKEKTRRDAQNDAARQLRYRDFQKELGDIEVYLVTDSQGRIRHGATADYKKSARAQLRLKYREFASEVHD